jgi:hypothetical protein
LTDQPPQQPLPPQQPQYQQPPPGYPPPPYAYAYQPPPSAPGVSIASLACGIGGLLFGWIPFVGIIGLFAAIAAVVTGILGLQRPHGRGFAIAGIICGALTIMIWCIGLVFIIVAAANYHGG